MSFENENPFMEGTIAGGREADPATPTKPSTLALVGGYVLQKAVGAVEAFAGLYGDFVAKDKPEQNPRTTE